MKLFTYSLIALLLCSSSSFAAQNISCSFADPDNTDKIVIVLLSDQSGTLQYSSAGDDEQSTDTMDEKLKIKRINASDANSASFSTEVESMQMIFQMPKAMVLKPGSQFKASLSTKIDSVNTTEVQDLSCSS